MKVPVGNDCRVRFQLKVEGLTKIKELIYLYTPWGGGVILNKSAVNRFVKQIGPKIRKSAFNAENSTETLASQATLRLSICSKI